jgi:hypothetical protein
VLTRVISCEIHFKQSVRRHSRYLGEDSSGDEFVALADKLLYALSEQNFQVAFHDMTRFSVNHHVITDWLAWWFDRRSHVFRCFKPVESPCSNLAEVGHAKMSNTGRAYMSLLEAAREDVALSIRQEVECKLCDEGVKTGGSGSDCRQKKSRQHQRAMKQAAEYGAEIVSRAHMQPFVPTSLLTSPSL